MMSKSYTAEKYFWRAVGLIAMKKTQQTQIIKKKSDSHKTNST